MNELGFCQKIPTKCINNSYKFALIFVGSFVILRIINLKNKIAMKSKTLILTALIAVATSLVCLQVMSIQSNSFIKQKENCILPQNGALAGYYLSKNAANDFVGVVGGALAGVAGGIVGGYAGSFIGGAIGSLGGPAGAVFGVWLGGRIGSFVGTA
jgi:hypothetical protein